MPQPALIVIDVQNGMFDDPAGPPHNAETVVARIADLIAKARAAGAPIFFVQHDEGPDGAFHPGKPGFAYHPAVAPRPGEDVTVKRHSSAFHGTDLDAKLRNAGVDRLVVTGMQSEFCVDSCVRSAYERGYHITLASDAHSTLDTDVAKAKDIVAIQNRTLRSFARVVPAADILF